MYFLFNDIFHQNKMSWLEEASENETNRKQNYIFINILLEVKSIKMNLMQEFYNYDYYDSDHSEIDTPLFIYKTGPQ